MALPKLNDKIVAIRGTTQLSGNWTFAQLGAAQAEARTQFREAPLLPIVIVSLKNPADVLWKIEKR